MNIGNAGGNTSVQLFWPGRIFIAGAQACFDMADFDLGIVGGKAGGKRGSGVSMDENNIGQPLFVHVTHA